MKVCLHKWKKARLTTASDSEREVIELRKKLPEVKMENEILKKCMAPPPESTVERIILALGGTNAANVSGFCFVKALRLRALMESAP